MRTIRGRVLLKESGIGIPELTVVAYDATRGVAAEPPAFDRWKRIAAVLTNADGAFEIAYEDARADGGSGPDLVVVVLAPEDPSLDAKARILFQSDVRRASAGALEELIVRIPGAELDRVSLPHPSTALGGAEDPRSVVARMVAVADREAVLVDGGRLTNARDVERARKVDATFKSSLHASLRDRLSAIPPRLVDGDTFVKASDSVEAKNAAAVKKGVLEWINGRGQRKRAVMKRHVALTPAQLEALRGMLSAERTVDAAALTELLGTAATTHLRAIDPCRSASAAERACAEALGMSVPPPPAPEPEPPAPTPSPAPSPTPGDTPGDGVEASKERVRRFVARLIDTMTTPEERVVTDLEPRADSASVQANMRRLSLSPSPADTPAYHDFYSLQIAFEDVWQELVDEQLVDLAQVVFAETMELGGNPLTAPPAPGDDPFRVLEREAELAVRTHTTARRVRDHREGPVVRDHRDGGRPPWFPPRVPPTRVPPTRVPPSRPPTRDPRSDDPLERVPGLLAELNRRLKEPYAFTVFAANRKERAVNFGILVGYQQVWTPLAYQAGKLAKTITLAPKESRKYSKKVVVRRKRLDKETHTQARSVKEESEITSRVEQEILRKATAKTNFKLVSEGTANYGVGEASAASVKTTTSFERDVSRSSEEAKRGFHESVFKAAQDMKDELTTHVETEAFSEDETVDSAEITNPNDELAVTFLFYELQRRYRVNEKLHKVTPVVLVAQEMPRPDEITEAWVLAHDWIFRKVLLDESFRPALDYLCQHIAGDEVGLRELQKNVDQQRAIVDELRQEITVVRERILAQRELGERSLFGAAVKKKSGGSSFGIPIIGGIVSAVADTAEGLVREIGEFIHSPSASSEGRGNPLEDAIQRSVDQERELVMQLERETTALNAITERYAKGVADHRNRQSEVARMLVHIKANILHYMQAVWSFEPGDQRYFRLHKVRVPSFKPERTTVRFPGLTPRPDSMARVAHRRLGLDAAAPSDLYECEVVTEMNPELDYVDLAVAADLDEPLGFKGNYMIFRLRESNPVTDLQMAPYVVAGWNEIVDPDDIGNWTLDEFVRYVNCLKETLPEAEFATLQEQLRAQYQRLLSQPRRDGEVLTVPTDSLFIEALPATQTLMEEFKRRHRGVDVKRAQAEVRRIELENLRYAMRVLEKELGDPDVDKHVVVNGGSHVIVPPADA